MIRPQNIDFERVFLCAYVCKGNNAVADDIKRLSDAKHIYNFDELNVWILSNEQLKELSSAHPYLFDKAPTIRLTGGIKLPSEKMPCWMKGAGPLMEAQNLNQEQDSV